MYTQSITRTRRTAFILAIDGSGSMAETIRFRGRTTTKAEAVAAIANDLLFELIERARRDDGVRDYYDLAAVGYSGDDEVRPLLPGGRSMMSVSELAALEMPVLPDGSIALREIPSPAWIEPCAAGQTPMYQALAEVRDMSAAWCARKENAASFPPVIFNITDGEATDCDEAELRAVAAQIRAEYNLDKPFLVQYLLFLKNAFTLDFGNTFSGQPVINEIGRAFPVTIKLALMAFCFEAIFGCVFGVISGLKKGKWYDSVILIVSLLLISVPTFVTGFLGQYFLGVKWSILPVTAGSNPGFFDLLMPAMVLGSVSMAYIIRLARSEVSSNVSLDYPPHSAQFDDPRRHVSGSGPWRADGRRHDHRTDLQHPRHRLPDLPEHPQGRSQHGRLGRHTAHARVRGVQPACRHAVCGT